MTWQQCVFIFQKFGKPCSDLYSRGIKSQNVTTRLFYFFFTLFSLFGRFDVFVDGRHEIVDPTVEFHDLFTTNKDNSFCGCWRNSRACLRCLLGWKYKHVALLILIDRTRWWTRLPKAYGIRTQQHLECIWFGKLVNPLLQTSEINDAAAPRVIPLRETAQAKC